jgi:hypothetical protein
MRPTTTVFSFLSPTWLAECTKKDQRNCDLQGHRFFCAGYHPDFFAGISAAIGSRRTGGGAAQLAAYATLARRICYAYSDNRLAFCRGDTGIRIDNGYAGCAANGAGGISQSGEESKGRVSAGALYGRCSEPDSGKRGVPNAAADAQAILQAPSARRGPDARRGHQEWSWCAPQAPQGSDLQKKKRYIPQVVCQNGWCNRRQP